MNYPSTPTMRATSACVVAKVPVLLWSDPGQGKTSKITAIGERSGYHVETVVGSVREPSDYLGLPIEKDGGVVYAPPAWAVRLNEHERSLLFLDELSTASPSVQKANLRLLQERFAGDLALADGVAMIAAANPPETAADGWDLPAPVANRMCHLDWVFNPNEWLENVASDFDDAEDFSFADLTTGGTQADYARTAGMLAGFLKHRPDLLAPAVPTDPIKSGRGWASPRSWHNLARVLAHVDRNDDAVISMLATGMVGDGAAIEFIAWYTSAALYDPSEVMNDPSIVDWKARPDQIFALMVAIEALVKADGTAKAWQKGVEVCTVAGENGRPDGALVTLQRLLSRTPEGASIPPRTKATFASVISKTQWGSANAA